MMLTQSRLQIRISFFYGSMRKMLIEYCVISKTAFNGDFPLWVKSQTGFLIRSSSTSTSPYNVITASNFISLKRFLLSIQRFLLLIIITRGKKTNKLYSIFFINVRWNVRMMDYMLCCICNWESKIHIYSCMYWIRR